MSQVEKARSINVPNAAKTLNYHEFSLQKYLNITLPRRNRPK